MATSGLVHSALNTGFNCNCVMRCLLLIGFFFSVQLRSQAQTFRGLISSCKWSWSTTCLTRAPRVDFRYSCPGPLLQKEKKLSKSIYTVLCKSNANENCQILFIVFSKFHVEVCGKILTCTWHHFATKSDISSNFW